MVDATHNGSQSEQFNQRGIELADRGWLEEALREFDRAIDLDGSSPFPRINRASVYLEQGRMREALTDLISAVSLAPEDPATHYHLGLFLTRYGSELGILELQKALSLDPDHLDALLQLGATHADRGELEDAENAIGAALDLDPDDPLANREMGILHLDRGRVHEAIRTLKIAVEGAPNDVDLLVDLGVAYLQAGFWEKAEQILSLVAQREPDNLYAHYNLAAIAAQTQRQDQVFAHLDRALALDPHRVRGWLTDDPLLSGMRNDARFQAIIGGRPPHLG